MFRKILKSKIHRATVTEANLEYEGSITVDQGLMEAAGMVPFECLRIANLRNGERFETYVIPGEPGSGVVCINGAAAHKAGVGDLIIIFQYIYADAQDLRQHQPTLVYVDGSNRIVQK